VSSISGADWTRRLPERCLALAVGCWIVLPAALAAAEQTCLWEDAAAYQADHESGNNVGRGCEPLARGQEVQLREQHDLVELEIQNPTRVWLMVRGQRVERSLTAVRASPTLKDRPVIIRPGGAGRKALDYVCNALSDSGLGKLYIDASPGSKAGVTPVEPSTAYTSMGDDVLVVALSNLVGVAAVGGAAQEVIPYEEYGPRFERVLRMVVEQKSPQDGVFFMDRNGEYGARFVGKSFDQLDTAVYYVKGGYEAYHFYRESLEAMWARSEPESSPCYTGG